MLLVRTTSTFFPAAVDYRAQLSKGVTATSSVQMLARRQANQRLPSARWSGRLDKSSIHGNVLHEIDLGFGDM